jgi:phosphoribosylformimino-5-aminoimidazole carboxamide ribotide isomerase
MKFRPCIDLHHGVVKQIVGSTLSDQDSQNPVTNFTSKNPSEWYALKYKEDNLTGGHVIQLGKGNQSAAKAALGAWPGGMQIGGGINIDNAVTWLNYGASAVIVTSWVFHGGNINMARLENLVKAIGKEHLVLDLSCRKKENAYMVVTDRWQTFTREAVTHGLLDRLSAYCSEFLIHAVDVEGKCSGIEIELVKMLGTWNKIPVTYAGGIHSMEDIKLIEDLGKGHIDFTVGSALDIFGGQDLAYKELARLFSKTKSLQ